MPDLVHRVDRLEAAHEEFVRTVGIEFNKMYSGLISLQMEMVEFKDEMAEFKNEMAEFKQEVRAGISELNKKWGELSNKLGSFTEDFVHPSLPRIVREHFHCELEFFAINIQRHLADGRTKEYDAIGIAGERLFLVSTKSTIREKHFDSFIEELKGFRDFFPEYKNKKIIGILAALSISENHLRMAENLGLLVLTVGDGVMQLRNTAEFEPKYW